MHLKRLTGELKSSSGNERPPTFTLVTMAALLIMELSPAISVILVVGAILLRRPPWWAPWAWGLALLGAGVLAAAFGLDLLLDRLALLFVTFMTAGLVILLRDERTKLQMRKPLQCRATTRQGSPCRRSPVHGSEYCYTHRHLEAAPALNGHAAGLP
jgi:hypothetical protein